VDPLVRVLTGALAGAEGAPCDPLVRVLTGALAGAEGEPCDPLVRVLTGALAGAEGEPCDPLVRVLTGALAGAEGEPCDPLVRVLTGALAVAACPALAPPEPLAWKLAAGSWRMMWIVRRITWVRTSTAGLRAASVPVVAPSDGLSANAARPPATSAMTAATNRERLVRMYLASESWGRRRLCRVGPYRLAKRWQRFGKGRRSS
jgi:hypothetical protein